MDSLPSKRVLTETTLDSRSVVDGSTRNDGVSDELRALLRNRAARVRKSVMEGYSIDRTALQVEHSGVGSDVAEPPQIFQSSREINNRVLRNWTPSPFSSPKKRSRYDYEAEDALEKEDEGEGMEIDPVEPNPQGPAEDVPRRPIKPLRRTLFPDTCIAPKPPISKKDLLRADQESSHSDNPFL